MEEVRPPNLTDLKIICDEMFDKREIAAMELEICSVLKWYLTPVNCLTWLKFYQNNINRQTNDFIDLGCYSQLDVLIHSNSILDFLPSKIAAALIHDSGTDDKILEKCTGYTLTDLQSELTWLRSWKVPKDCGSIAYANSKELKSFTDEMFEEMILEHRRVLNFISKRIKLE